MPIPFTHANMLVAPLILFPWALYVPFVFLRLAPVEGSPARLFVLMPYLLATLSVFLAADCGAGEAVTVALSLFFSVGVFGVLYVARRNSVDLDFVCLLAELFVLNLTGHIRERYEGLRWMICVLSVFLFVGSVLLPPMLQTRLPSGLPAKWQLSPKHAKRLRRLELYLFSFCDLLFTTQGAVYAWAVHNAHGDAHVSNFDDPVEVGDSNFVDFFAVLALLAGCFHGARTFFRRRLGYYPARMDQGLSAFLLFCLSLGYWEREAQPEELAENVARQFPPEVEMSPEESTTE